MSEDGSQQDRRFPEALSTRSILVDETSLAARIAMLRDHAQALDFVDQTGAVVGRWSELLDRDPSVLIARSLALRLDVRERRFLDDFTAARVLRMGPQLRELAGWLDDWLQALGQVGRPETRALADRIERQVMALVGSDWRVATGLAAPQTMADLVAQLGDWLAERTGGRRAAAPTPRTLRAMYFALLEAIRAAQSAAAAVFAESLNSGLHEPATGLLLAFAQTFVRIQDRVNDFTERHLDFYYHAYLELKPRPAEPDSVHLVLTRDPNYLGEVKAPQGLRFVAGRDSVGREITFEAAWTLDVTDANVVALKTLRLERDPMISPEREFDFVSRARVAEYEPDIGPESLLEREAAALMGGNVLGCISGDREARIGLAVASPMLDLKEGERRIDLTLEFALPSEMRSAETMTAELVTEADCERFYEGLGGLFTAWLMWDGFGLTDGHLDDLRRAVEQDREGGAFVTKRRLSADAASENLANDPLFLLLGQAPELNLEGRRILVRDQLFASFFMVEVTTATGWREIPDPIPGPNRPAAALTGAMGITLTLNPEDPPIVAYSPEIHGEDWPVDTPALRLTLRQQSLLFPLSIFDGLLLEAVEIDVEATGIRDLCVFNHLGRLDPGKPFQPFGPLPDTASYLVVGAPEISIKEVTSLSLVLDWAGLPAGGFAQYYEGYDPPLADGDFTVATRILRDGRWTPPDASQALFAVDEDMLLPRQTVDLPDFSLRANWRPMVWTANRAPLVFDQRSRNAFVRLELSGPPSGFGQASYPVAVSQSVRANLGKGKPQPMPNPPYAPTLAGLTLNYTATTRIEVGPQAEGPDRVLHLHPFGFEVVQPPVAVDRRPGVLPALGRDGQLLIGLSASDLQGELTLLFELREDTASERMARRRPRPTLEWSWLADDLWRPLGNGQIVLDTTMGFLTSGVIKLNLPSGLTKTNRILPGGLYWLRVASDWTSDSFAGLQGVHAQALMARRTLETPPEGPLAPGAITLKSASIPGVVALRQSAPSFGLRAPENDRQERTRIGERLRHKQRAVTPWDYERLVLEAFPNVQKAKCLPNTSHIDGGAMPGEVLVVVVPAPPLDDPLYRTRALQLNALELDQIAEALPKAASPFARINVRNATYERIQVRCVVSLARGAHFGDVLKRINDALVDYLSPWRPGGFGPRFGWSVRGDDIESCIRAVDQVRSVAGISLIRVWEDDQPMTNAFYHFEDTAVATDPGATVELAARRPWSLCLPLEDHIIEVMETERDEAKPSRTGVAAPQILVGSSDVAGLRIGTTWVVGDEP